jgi:hypothetical protein
MHNMERSYSRYLLVVLCVAITCTALILVALNAYSNSKKTPLGYTSGTVPSDQAIADSYRNGFETAMERFQKYGLGVQGDAHILIGTVQQNSGGKLIVLQENLMTDALVSGVSDDREVIITACTKITRATKKSAAQFAAEQDAFAKLPPSPNTQPPSPTTQTSIKISDIKIGDVVAVTAKEADITNAASLTATDIVVTVSS